MIFDDYEYKDLTKQIEFKLMQKSDNRLISTWELSNFMNNLNSYYYKMEIIETIGIALNNNIQPHNIFILDASFKLNQLYSKIDILNLNSKDIVSMSNIGKPISMFPNNHLYKINYLIHLVGSLNDILKEIKPFRYSLSGDDLVESYSIIKSEGLEKAIDYIKRKIFSIINIDKKDFNSKISNKCNEVKEKYNDFINDKNLIELVDTYFNKNMKLEIKDKKIESIIEKYYQRFFIALSKISRPVVGIYYNEEDKVKILCKAHINKTKTNTTFLDLKSVSHNSPTSLDYFSGLIIGKLFDEVLNYEEKSLKKELLREQINTEKEKQITEKLKQLDIINKLNENNTLMVSNNVKKVNNAYLQNQLSNMQSNIGFSTYRLLKKNNFDLIDTKVISIDTKV